MLAAIETTGDSCAVAVLDGDRLLVELRAEMPRAHDRLLASLFRGALNMCSLTPEEVSVVALSVGPGSYTGIRIGMSFAVGFASAMGIPITPVSTLDSIAWSARSIGEVGGRNRVLSLIPDRRGGVYAALYEISPQFNRLTAPYNLPIDELVHLLDENVFAAGPGATLIGDKHADYIAHDTKRLTAVAVAEYGRDLFRRGITVEPDQIKPLYISGVITGGKE
ncbi:MAG: tRNA (adenosine(37)-N6)-threonylcarbamoyltransferase complex dimerization subunit type 1 TsaB [Ignavibacteriae bacterium]|nr:tRNA (adenosine(37)-N6)-threonylcarbamoyltransferase complex dimerization subunit type 1 TsaB [Ignavibacteriota bacterium]MCB9216404.1 tRNA (adenosine(37)-N6)-threonylcarbamoyltransferase complex dimerization subunit type 1 TsaB [Ignavibacteria bacterium]